MIDNKLDIYASWIARYGLSDQIKVAMENGLTGIRLIMKGDLYKVPEEVMSFSHQLKLFNPNVKLMIDLPGSKPRLGRVNEGITVKQGQLLFLHHNASAKMADNSHICSEGLSEYCDSIHVNDRLLINDDETVFVVKDINSSMITVQLVSNDTSIISYRSISLPDSNIHYRGLTDYDIQALRSISGIEKVDSVALSMVSNSNEVLKGKEIISSLLGDVEVIAKIETPEAIDNIISICVAADSVMIARGDMRTLCGPERIFFNQQTVINTAKQHNTSIIAATGILASLGSSVEPSISELCDVGYFRYNGIHRFLIADAALTLKHPSRACEWIHLIFNN